MDAQRETRIRVQIGVVLIVLGLPLALAAAWVQDRPKDSQDRDEAPPAASLPSEFQPTEGWVWGMTPKKIKSGTSHLLLLEGGNDEPSSSWRRTGRFAAAAVPRKRGTAYAIAAFDAERRKVEMLASGSVSDGFVKCSICRVVSEAAYAGIEVLTVEARRRAAAAAFEKAKQKGLSPLPYAGDGDDSETWPEGVYDFELTIDGRTLTRGSFPGKIVIIDCWATWCAPCMALMPDLIDLSKKHEKELGIISISYDDDAKKAQNKLKSLGVSWPLLVIPKKEKDRGLWLTALHGDNNGTVPVVMVIDRDGRMQHVYPYQLKEVVAKLLGSNESEMAPQRPDEDEHVPE